MATRSDTGSRPGRWRRAGRRPGAPSTASPSAAEAPAGSPRTPLGATAWTPPARSSGSSSAIGRASPATAASARTSSGCRASMQRGLGPPGVGVDVAPRDPSGHPPALAPEGAGGAGQGLGVAAVPRDEHDRAERVGGPDQLDHHVLERRPGRSTGCRRTRRARRWSRRAGRGPRPRPAACAAARSATATATSVSVDEREVGSVLLGGPQGHDQDELGGAAELGPRGRAEVHGVLGSGAGGVPEARRDDDVAGRRGRGCRPCRCPAGPSRSRPAGCRARSPRRPARWRRGPRGRPGRS